MKNAFKGRAITSTGESYGERDFRWERVRKFIDKHGLDALLAFASENLGVDHYLTNDRPGQHVLFPRDGGIVSMGVSSLVVTQNFVSRERGEETWVEDIRIGMTGAVVAEIIREKRLENKVIGTVGLGGLGSSFMRDGWVPYQTFESIKKALPNTDFKDVTLDFLLLMVERSKQDVGYVRRAAAAGEEACKVLLESIKPGASEFDVYAAGMSAFHGTDVQATSMILTSGPDNFSWGNPTWIYRSQASRILEEGDILMIEMFPQYAGVESQLQLAVAIGKVHRNHEVCAKAARKAYEIAVSMIRPGVLFSEVCDAMQEPVREIGGWHLTPMLHTLNPLTHTDSVGLGIEKQVPELAQLYVNVHGRERIGGDFELKPGMCIELEPNAHLGRHRVNIGGAVVVTETGVEELNKTPTRMQYLSA